MKYEYCLETWGGFYNPEHQLKHAEKEGRHYFESEEERKAYLTKLRGIEKELNAKQLVTNRFEGYNVRVETVLHRVIKYDGREIHTECKLSPNTTYSQALYHLKYKWYPGFNDCPLGEDFDYENAQFSIIQEWITGAFDRE